MTKSYYNRDQYLVSLEPKEYDSFAFERIRVPLTLADFLEREQSWVVTANKSELAGLTNANVLYLSPGGQNYQPVIYYFDNEGRIQTKIEFEDSDLYLANKLGLNISLPRNLTQEIANKIRIAGEDISKLTGLRAQELSNYSYFNNQQIRETIVWGRREKNNVVIRFEREARSPELIIPALPMYGLKSKSGFYSIQETRSFHPEPSDYLDNDDPLKEWREERYFFAVMGFGNIIYRIKDSNPYRRTPEPESYLFWLENDLNRVLKVIDENEKLLKEVEENKG